MVEHITVATLNLVPVLEIEIFFLISFCILKNFYLFLAALGLLWFMWAFSSCKKKKLKSKEDQKESMQKMLFPQVHCIVS